MHIHPFCLANLTRSVWADALGRMYSRPEDDIAWSSSGTMARTWLGLESPERVTYIADVTLSLALNPDNDFAYAKDHNFRGAIEKAIEELDLQRLDQEKLESGIRKACMKRPISRSQIRSLVSEIEEEIMKKEKPSKMTEGTKEITSEQIGAIVMEKLKTLDKVAYIRFASVYESFDDIKAFDEEIKELKK